MINKGSPAWSDKYRCAEWPWFNGVIDAMAFGNHDPDYGIGAMQACLQSDPLSGPEREYKRIQRGRVYSSSTESASASLPLPAATSRRW